MDFIKTLIKIINTGQSRSIILTGNLYDLFQHGDETLDTASRWIPLIDFLSEKCKLAPSTSSRGITQIIYRLNKPIEIIGDKAELEAAWNGVASVSLDERLEGSNRNVTYALELLRQLSYAMRQNTRRKNNLLIIIEAADVLIPESELNRMALADRQRVATVHDWFSDPKFVNGGDTVVLLSESRSNLHHRIARLPQVISIEVGLPNLETRDQYLSGCSSKIVEAKLSIRDLAEQTAGLSIHALRQLVLSGDINADTVATKVEEYMIGQLGDGVIEFKRPIQKLADVIGFSVLKKFLSEELIPAFKAGNISGAAVGGPIGGGKTFLCEAVAAELGIPVITLKNIRSKWYGETDAIFERLQRLLETFHRIVIFVDEADTQFGSVDSGEQATERRLTGKIQAMMSDVKLKGRVIWFLMTARIHLLSPDIRRPGRMDLIIPVLDPEGNDREEFLKWVLGDLYTQALTSPASLSISKATAGWSAASFAMLKSQIKQRKCKTLQEVVALTGELLMPDIGLTRTYQTVQALLNCTRRSLLPANITDIEEERRKWQATIVALEAKGIR